MTTASCVVSTVTGSPLAVARLNLVPTAIGSAGTTLAAGADRNNTSVSAHYPAGLDGLRSFALQARGKSQRWVTAAGVHLT